MNKLQSIIELVDESWYNMTTDVRYMYSIGAIDYCKILN